jgi:hypothetical protein
VDTTNLFDDYPPAIRDGLLQQFGKITKPSTMFLDKKLISEGGYAFLVSDLVSVDDLMKIFSELGVPLEVQAGKAIAKILQLYSKLREIRIELSEPEFIVLRGIKRGLSSRAALAEGLMLPLEKVELALKTMADKSKLYKPPLFSEDDGKLSTIF